MLRMLMLVALCVPSLLWAASSDRVRIEQRIKPYGQVRIEGQNGTADSVPAVTQVSDAEEEDVPVGKEIYGQYCAACHQRGLAGAPVFRKAESWEPLLAKKSLDELTATSIKGINAMPAKGTCNRCSEDDLRAAIEYMLPQE
ncbi:MAG: cytochrome c5 family protein [Legionellaceae bacterium]|nr:cytochrome c5 family protein [Legionellaceae bacterium]